MYSDLQISQVFTVSYMCKSALLNRETLSSEKKKKLTADSPHYPVLNTMIFLKTSFLEIIFW